MILFRKLHVVPARLLLLIFLLNSPAAMAFSLLEWLGFGEEDQQQVESDKEDPSQTQDNWAKSSPTVAANEKDAQASDGQAGTDAGIRFDDIKLIIANLNPEQRKKLLSDEEAFRQFIERQAANESVLEAARANNLQNDPFTHLLMRKSAENTLREIYIKRLINKELPEDFPSEEQARSFYENNPDRFTLEERMHVWQIFLPFGPDADDQTKSRIRKEATSLKKDIEKNKLSFADAATRYSEHIPSRHAGGYMGLIKLSDIKPEIEKAVLALEEGQLSEPIVSADGYHLLQRGSRIAAATLPFEQVKARINQALRQEAEKRLRQAIYKKASETYQLDLEQKRVEEWRLKLRTNL